MDRDAVGPAVVFARERPFERGRDSKYAAERNVGDVQIAFAIERRPLEEAVDLMTRLVRISPFRAPLAPKRVRQARENPGLDDLRRGESEIPHGVIVAVFVPSSFTVRGR